MPTTSSTATPSPRRLFDYALLLLLATVWGASYTFIKIGVATIPPITLIAVRTLIAGLLLLAVLHWRGIVLPREVTTWKRFTFQALMNSVIPFTLIAWGELTVNANLAAILNATTPVFTFLITWAVTRHEPATLGKLAGIGLGLLGTCLIVGIETFQGLGIELLGQAAIVLATVCYAVAAIFGRHFKGYDPMVPAAGSMIAGAVLLIPASFLIDRPWTLSPSAASIAALVGLSVVSTALAFTIYFKLIGSLGSVATTSQSYLRVPIGVGIGMAVLGETLAPSAVLGLVCTVAGVALMTVPPDRLRVPWLARPAP